MHESFVTLLPGYFILLWGRHEDLVRRTSFSDSIEHSGIKKYHMPAAVHPAELVFTALHTGELELLLENFCKLLHAEHKSFAPFWVFLCDLDNF